MPPKRKAASVTIQEPEREPTAASSAPVAGSSDRRATRREIAREVAVNSIGKFARGGASQQSTQKSTTPTGYFRASSSSEAVEGDGSSKPMWPGPFATAHEIMKKRKEMKQKREAAAQAASSSSSSGVIKDDVPLDQYDAFLQRAQWTPRITMKNPQMIHIDGRIPSLEDICIKVVAKSLARHTDLQFMSVQARDKLLRELATNRLFNAEAADLLTFPGSDSLYYPDCSMLEAVHLVQRLKKVAGLDASQAAVADLKMTLSDDSPFVELRLERCGHCFDDFAAASQKSLFSRLQSLTLTGLYRLSEDKAKLVLEQCAESLQHLDLSFYSNLSRRTLELVARMPQLRSLVLDNAVHLVDSDLESLLDGLDQPTSSSSSASSSSSMNAATSSEDAPRLPLLERLSLQGLTEISDATALRLIGRYGAQLTYLNLGGCVKLTDAVIVAIRQHCGRLSSLHLDDLSGVSSSALLSLFLVNPLTSPLESGATGGEAAHALDPLAVSVTKTDDDPPTGAGAASTTAASTAVKQSARDMDHPQVIEADLDGVFTETIGLLREVSLAGAVETTDEVLIALMENYGRSLAMLNLNGCKQITSRGFAAMVFYGRESLVDLDISFVRSVSEDVVGIFLDAVGPQFRQLVIWGCSQLTERLFYGYSQRSIAIAGRFNRF